MNGAGFFWNIKRMSHMSFLSAPAPGMAAAAVSDFKSFSLYHHKKLFCLLPTISSKVPGRSPLAELKPLVVSSRESSATPKTPAADVSFTVSYLVSSCGLSLESATAVSQKVQLKSPEQPDSVIELLKTYGFSKAQISNFIRKRPAFLLADAEKTLLPKLEFFRSIGLPSSDLARILSSDTTLMTRSLENQILPSYAVLKSIVLSDEKIVAALRRTTWIFLGDQSKSLIPNIELLRELEVPQRCISLLLSNFPEALMQKHEDFAEIVGKVRGMGFEPKKSTFVVAVHALSGKCNNAIWQRSFTVYKRWNWTKEDILGAFRKHPNCMMLSEEKIMKNMDYFVNKMGYPSRMIAQCPVVLFFSLEKRIIPRFSVMNVLSSKGLLEKEFSLQTVLHPAEKYFLERFVFRFEDLAPELLSVYHGKLELAMEASGEP